MTSRSGLFFVRRSDFEKPVAGVLLIFRDSDLRSEVDGEPLTTVQSLAIIEFRRVGFAPKHVYRNIHRCTVASVGQQFEGFLKLRR